MHLRQPDLIGGIHLTDGHVVMVARQRLLIGRTYTGQTATIGVKDTYFRTPAAAPKWRCARASPSTPSDAGR